MTLFPENEPSKLPPGLWHSIHISGVLLGGIKPYDQHEQSFLPHRCQKRIYNAEALLQNTQYNINEIAQIVG